MPDVKMCVWMSPMSQAEAAVALTQTVTSCQASSAMFVATGALTRYHPSPSLEYIGYRCAPVFQENASSTRHTVNGYEVTSTRPMNVAVEPETTSVVLIVNPPVQARAFSVRIAGSTRSVRMVMRRTRAPVRARREGPLRDQFPWPQCPFPRSADTPPRSGGSIMIPPWSGGVE